MEPYLVFSDIDGTLVIDHQVVTPYTKKVIETLQNQNVIFYIATGRLYRSGKEIAQQINDQVHIVASNGAVFEDHETLSQQHMGKAALRAAYQVAAEEKLSVHFFSPNAAYYTKEIPRFIARAKANITNFGSDIEYAHLDGLSDLLAKRHQITNGIIVGRNNPAALKRAQDKLAALNVMNLSSSGPDNIELIPSGIDKAIAIRKVQALHGIDPEHTFVFGDGRNDLGMLQEAKYSVAMGNALPEVKQTANYVTETNDEDGVAHFLQRHFQLAGL